MKAKFVRKPRTVEDVIQYAKSPWAYEYEFRIEQTIQLSGAAYRFFSRNLLLDQEWLKGKGGWEKRDGAFIRKVVAVTSPGCPTLYVDPSGESYGRYVAIDDKRA